VDTVSPIETKAFNELEAKTSEAILGPNPFVGLRAVDIFQTAVSIVTQSFKRPALIFKQQATLALDLSLVLLSASPLQPPSGDKRFADEEWRENPLYKAWLQSYLAWRDALCGLVDALDFGRLPRERARYVTSLVTEALAPTNALPGNPAALKKAIQTRGSSVVTGLKNAIEDLVHNNAMPSQVEKSAFRVGENLALSPGAVVFQNEVLELIQYTPATGEVYSIPQLIIPPQINKFYVFDISPSKSIVQHLVKNGFQVFMVSWRNPNAQHKNWDLDTYVGALLDAIETTRDITGSGRVNLHGACSGAMTMGALLGYLAASNNATVSAATLMVAVFSLGGDSQLGLFASPETIAAAKANSALKGVLDGSEMGKVFAWLRPNDLVWNYWVNNYLLGNRPPKFDILYWNNDSTRLPAKFHAQLLDVFGDRLFERPGALKVLGTPIDLRKVTCDKFFVAGLTDHITSWKGVYATARLFGGPNEFLLSSSGHIQSLINPPGNPKAKYFTNPDMTLTPEKWRSGAKEMSGSWWDQWVEWLAAHSGSKREAPDALGNERYRPLIGAPGTYVLEP
jgi:polyhydroxyalkanoate synthase